MNSESFLNNLPEVLQRVSAGVSFPVYEISDDSALVVDGDMQEFIGGERYKVTLA